MNRKYLRHYWSHELWLHRFGVRLFNASMARIPFPVKYEIGKKLRQNQLPYSLLKDDSIVIQVGAPKDTLQAGRSRAMHFSLAIGDKGKVVVVEPSPENVDSFNAMLAKAHITSTKVCQVGAWSEKSNLKLYFNESHPATSFTAGTRDFYDENRLRDYQVIDMPVDTLDNIVTSLQIKKVDLVSITANGVELEILRGMKDLIASGLPYISMARTGEGYVDVLSELGFELLGYDDRGYTFENTKV